MEKIIKTLIKKMKTISTNETISNLKSIDFKSIKSKLLIPQLKGAAVLLCATSLVLSGAFTLNYLETNDNNFCPTPSYSAYIDGEEICKVRDPQILEDAMLQLKKNIQEESPLEVLIENNFSVEQSEAISSEIIAEEKVYDLIKSKINYSNLAYSIKIDGTSVGVVETKESAEAIVKNTIDHFTQNVDKSTIVDVNTTENVEIVQVRTNESQIQDPETLENYIIKGTNQEMIYTVESGDSYWSIAEKHDMTLDDLITANAASDPESIQIGDTLSLVVPKPFISVQVKRKITFQEQTKYDTAYEYVSYLYNDEQSVKKAGVYGVSQVEAIVTEQNGLEIAKEVLSEKVVSTPESEIIVTGTQDPPPKQGTGIFINPLPASIISSRFGQRTGDFHTGLDMCRPKGSDIKAADGGTVVFTGWSGTYGYLVEIDHGGGFTTRYAHCSEILVTTGEKVYQGKIIALVGDTGLASGYHLHFEVRKYGSAFNPQDYIGTQYK